MKRLLALTALLGLLLGLVAIPALGQAGPPPDRPPDLRPPDDRPPSGVPPEERPPPYPPPPDHVVRPDVTITNPRATVNIEGRNWGPNTVIEVIYEDNAGEFRSLASTETDDTGAFTAAITIPADAPEGAFDVQVAGTGADGVERTRQVALTVDKAAASATAPRGSPSVTFWTVGNTLLVVGVMLGIALLFLGPVRRRWLTTSLR